MTTGAPDPPDIFETSLHRQVKKFLRNHPDLDNKWEKIVDAILKSPRLGPHIDHLKGDWFCSYRYDEGDYRIKYQVLEPNRQLYFFDAGNRGEVYQRKKGSQRQVR